MFTSENGRLKEEIESLQYRIRDLEAKLNEIQERNQIKLK